MGANNEGLDREDLEPLLQDGAGGFLVSFEPLLDKYLSVITSVKNVEAVCVVCLV